LDAAEVNSVLGKFEALLARARQSKGAKSAPPPPRRAPAPPTGHPPVDPAMDFPPFAPPEAGF
jgi:hypothetical protein